MNHALSKVSAVFVLLATCGLAAQPDQNYVLRFTPGSGPPGGQAEVEVRFDNFSADSIAGWEFGVCHDPTAMEVADVLIGATTETVKGGDPPEFYITELLPGEGWLTGVVINVAPPFIFLEPGSDYHFNTAVYHLMGALGETSEVVFCDTLGDPIVETLIITPLGTTIVPTQEPGQVSLSLIGFRRGDVDGGGSFQGLVDGVYALNYQFVGGSPEPPCLDAADANDDGSFSGLVDGIYCLNFHFVGGNPAPPSPGPFVCGLDPTDDALGCTTYNHCP